MIPSSDWNSYPSTQVKVGTFFSNSCARRLEFMQRCNSLRKSTTLQRKDRSGNKNLMVWLPEMFFFSEENTLRRVDAESKRCCILESLLFNIWSKIPLNAMNGSNKDMCNCDCSKMWFQSLLSHDNYRGDQTSKCYYKWN